MDFGRSRTRSDWALVLFRRIATYTSDSRHLEAISSPRVGYHPAQPSGPISPCHTPACIPFSGADPRPHLAISFNLSHVPGPECVGLKRLTRGWSIHPLAVRWHPQPDLDSFSPLWPVGRLRRVSPRVGYFKPHASRGDLPSFSAAVPPRNHPISSAGRPTQEGSYLLQYINHCRHLPLRLPTWPRSVDCCRRTGPSLTSCRPGFDDTFSPTSSSERQTSR